ncbi:MAG: hypothetical protein QG646_2390 [Euryarchaeota archaeon]|nr:hypothetical protein [Euryarchaeota archaeon]
MTKMTIIDALKMLASLNIDGMSTLIQDSSIKNDEPTMIEWEIEKIYNFENVEAEIMGFKEEFEIHDYYVDDSCIRENDENGLLLYWVAGEIV